MKHLQCLIVEDEPLAAEILEDYIRMTPSLELAAHCRDALQAMAWLQENSADVLFLALHLPKLKGFDFLRALSQPPQVVITTAYEEHALQGYEFEVVDYLVKPIEFARFLQAVARLRRAAPEAPAHLFFNVNKRQVKVMLDDILYVESLKEYVRIHTRKGAIVTKYQLGGIESLLSGPRWLRIHRSFLVAVDKVEAFSAADVEVGGKRLPIGPAYREEVERALGEGGRVDGLKR
jgi:DNA-binding LytR/AlgR family response regulator